MKSSLCEFQNMTKQSSSSGSTTCQFPASSREKKTAILLWALTILYCLFIFYLSSLEGEEIEESSPTSAVSFLNEESDKLEHFLLYFGLGCLVYGAFKKSLPLNPDLLRLVDHLGKVFSQVFEKEREGTGFRLCYGLVAISFLFIALYGLSDEVHQYFVPGRSSSAFDLLVDGAGGLFAALFMNWFFRRRGSCSICVTAP